MLKKARAADSPICVRLVMASDPFTPIALYLRLSHRNRVHGIKIRYLDRCEATIRLLNSGRYELNEDYGKLQRIGRIACVQMSKGGGVFHRPGHLLA